jgi:2-desacetyl-2-hydroxyethyl bacteriochlorophyllide A dehydrogenase
MPLELVVRTPKEIDFVEYQDREPGAGEVLVQTLVSGIKHGTELNMYRGTLPFAEQVWDPNLRLFRTVEPGEEIAPFYPHTLGSWSAGVVSTVGPGVMKFKPGDPVHGEWKHRQTMLLPEKLLYPVRPAVDGETMVFSDPARFALAAIHDAEIKLGDRVAIFGMGAIGALACQMAHLSGAAQVIVVDPIPGRLDLAMQVGADLAIDPRTVDTGLAIKQATQGKGVDVAIEISGVYPALQQAMRSVHREGLVVTASYYGGQENAVDLSREWHHNRLNLRSSMPVWSCASRWQPMWDLARLEQSAIDLLATQKLNIKPLIGERVPFEKAAEAYRMIDQPGCSKIKIILTYSN